MSGYPQIKFSVDAARRLRKAKYAVMPCTTFYTVKGPAAKTIWWDRSDSKNRQAKIVDRVEYGFVHFNDDTQVLIASFRKLVDSGDLILVGVVPTAYSHTELPAARSYF